MLIRFLICLVLASQSLLALTAKEIAEKSEAIYAEKQTFTVVFMQVVSTGDFFDDERTQGTMYLAYPKKYRIETPEQVFVSDGDTLWTYSSENRQVTIEPTNRLDDIVTPADYLFRLRENYELSSDSTEVIGERTFYRLSLRSLKDDQYVRSMKVLIDPDTYLIRRAVYRDINDNKITLDFSDWKLGVVLKPEQFRFLTPSGVEEVRIP